jgi:hypothetical protein
MRVHKLLRSPAIAAPGRRVNLNFHMYLLYFELIGNL